jgi:hypothetical protein
MTTPKPQPDDKPTVERDLTLAAFLGGLTFTGMIVLMQTASNFDYAPVSSVVYYPDILISTTGFVSAVFIIAAAGHASFNVFTNDDLKRYLDYLLLIGFFGVLILIPLLLLPFNVVGAVVIGSSEAIFAVILLRYVELI